ncbi:hypothetical protein P3X46_023926 [Hevea brasiliensis]|uniref:Uncharacterized protein n=1 Tax=Hevea brasiliensis TaxID=3981 RepID=A0ABQ9LFY3_HEVBR|nr:uncharacterized protein LOC110633813 [Hevea brasiliensis]KAJ9164335.1 hypothetical protein P3X46_023926 [Hevea brasiliensis]
MDKASTITTLTARRPKWQYPPAPPTPRILHSPRRKPPTKASAAKSGSQRNRKGKLETLFDQEREFTRGVMPIVTVSGGGDDRCEEERRERVEKSESVVMEEEKWRFQAEMLRAECNLLRMEREIAVKKMERRRIQVERALRSAVHTLLSGREKMCDGKNASMILEEEIIELAEKLAKLQRRSRNKDSDVPKCSNFDKQASLLQRRLEKFAGGSDEVYVKEIQEMAEASLSINTTSSIKEIFVSTCSNNMEVLRRKMEGLSKGSLLERMEVEYGLMLCTANGSASSSSYVATSKEIEFSEMSSSSMRQPCKERKPYEERACSGCCKAIVQRVVEQVRAETDQWSQMQEMLGQVRDEMEELQASRDFWEDRALDSDHQIQSLQSAVKEWRWKAFSSEAKANELQAQVSMLQAELEKLRKEKTRERSRTKSSAANLHDSPNDMEKRVLVCRLKENRQSNDDCCKQELLGDGRKKPPLNATKRSPFRDIGNSSPLVRQNSRAVFPLHCPLPSNVQSDS